MILASARRRCPDCNCVLEQAAVPTGPRRSRGAVRCQLIAEPTTLSALHVARWCKACARANFGCKTRFWCGFYETALPGKPGAYSKSIDVGFENDLYFMLNKSFGVAHTWLRRWRYRMYLHRASFQGEAVLLRLLDGNVQKKARQQLAQAWVREILWRRARECDTDLHKDLAGKLLCWPLEKLIHRDREDIVAIDGNCKLHRRTCGMPFAEVVPARDAPAPQAYAEIGSHRLKKAMLAGNLRVQFLKHSSNNTLRRELTATYVRGEPAEEMEWNAAASPSNHIPGILVIHTTSGSELLPDTQGFVIDLHELIGAESLSQRYHFAARLADRLPLLTTLVHDDACHLALMALDHRQSSVTAARLAEMSFIVDEFHAPGHTGGWCKDHCLPSIEANRAVLKNFPTDIAESVNSNFSPLGHTVHHMGQWFSQLALSEMVDVHNLVRLQSCRDRQRVASKKRQRPL
ncbi:hypothetical protein AK812_SmicGene4760 [Symbiodinium microadriaticum]|uniref:Uncharacterized protein n=1 Tax=Symbiodinium microadriaticum TaxID=2951 RepID=A0A1Q9EVI1_SYMMI|nr:hypothetical protein AK812_SmicGene4760 [Symbiodinium microadriaticum]CAE7718139.1 unnamed protein product [Symbiodinium sp. KB8]